MMVAALYIDEHGPYPKMPGVDAWGVTRDARVYEGPHPVVAHPPCGPWGAFAHMCKSPEQDPALAIRAVEQVRRWGGVLEHPRRSRLWAHVGLPLPGQPADEHGGRTIEVDQVEWGHAAHKRTWLYLFANLHLAAAISLRISATATHQIVCRLPSRKRRIFDRCVRHADEKRRRTPPLFASYLERLAKATR